MSYLSYLLIIINIGLLVYILVKIKDKSRLSTGMKILLGVGIFFSLGSICSLTDSNNEPFSSFPSIEASIFAIIAYAVYLYKVKLKKQPRQKTDETGNGGNSNLKKTINSNITDNVKEYKEKNSSFINNTNKKTKKKSVTGTVLGIMFLVLFAFIVIVGSSTDKNYEITKDMFAQYSVSYGDVINIVSNCGFTNFSITRDELIDNLWEEGTIGFRIKSDQSQNTTLYIKNNSVYNIRYADIDLYKNGEYLDNVTNYYISHNEHIDLMLKSQEIINKILKSPSTAKYPLYDQWSIVKNKENITVQCYVDAQNSFGAVGRSYFQIIFSNNVVTSLIFEGKEYIK